MKKNKLIISLFFVLLFLAFDCFIISLNAQPCKTVVGYYPNWQWYDRDKLVNPQSIDYSKYSILNYCFFNATINGEILITDPWSDKNLLLGPINWAVAPAGYDTEYDYGNPAYHNQDQKLSDYCHNNGVKLLPSIGGWTLSNNFSDIAANPTKRQTFALNCVELIDAFGFDGIDLDWEYPGFEEHNGTPQDKENFTLLLQDIRNAIDAYGNTVGKPMLLTICVGAAPARMEDVEWENIVEIVDMINLMSYDFFGAFDPITNHNAPLYAPEQGDPEFNLSSAVDKLIEVYNVPPSKINAGVAFYGRSAKTVNTPDLFVPNTGVGDILTFSLDEGTPLYYNALLQMNLFDYHWDDVAKVPYLTGKNNLKTFLSYDDINSIALKAEFVVEKELLGVIIWEITGDYIETSPGSGIVQSTPLVNKINEIFCDEANKINSNNNTNVDVYPNPASDFIILTKNDNQILNFYITDYQGNKIIENNNWTTSQEIISTEKWASGVYIIKILGNNFMRSIKVIVLK